MGSTLSRVVRSEWHKATNTVTAITILVVTSLLTIGMTVVATVLFRDGESWIRAYGQVASPAVTLLAVPLMLLVCEEWTRGTALVTFVQTPKRLRVLWAKALVGLVFLGVAYAITLVLSAVAGLFAQELRGIDVTWEFRLFEVLALGLPLVVNVGFGLAMALLWRETTLALGAYFVVPPITVLLAQVPGIGRFAKWVSLEHSSSIFVAGSDGVSTAQVFVSIVTWVVVPAACGVWLVVRSDIS
ncbi:MULTISPECIES: hypothetical protein [unclassified Actinomyces]|uniref:hypothetical protein n=1 Tax=unclassified Actinomyces TaxID=2609248 RepID=UPI0011BE31B7|nr:MULTISPECIES: hypothetical protein [unclassified Actinomyces]